MSRDLTWKERRAIVLYRAADLCELCHLAVATEVDHIWPRAWGGTDDLSNLQASCQPCNRAKGDRPRMDDLTGERAYWTEAHFAERADRALHTAAKFAHISDLIDRDGMSPAEAHAVADLGDSPEHLVRIVSWMLGDGFVVMAKSEASV